MLATLAGLAAFAGLVILVLALVGILKGLLALGIALLVIGIVAYVILTHVGPGRRRTFW